MARSPKNLVVHHHSLRRVWLAGGLMAAALALDSWLFFEYGLTRAGFDRESAADERGELADQLDELKKENAELRAQKAIVERASEIDRLAYTEVNRSLRDLQEQNLELREEAAFYRGIVTPAGAGPGLHIQSFKLTKNGQTPGYSYNLVLTHVMGNDRSIWGTIDLVVYGIQGGVPKQYNLAELSGASSGRLRFRFRYFQKFEGEMLLPDDFIPARVVLEVLPHDGRKVERSFDWAEVTT